MLLLSANQCDTSPISNFRRFMNFLTTPRRTFLFCHSLLYKWIRVVRKVVVEKEHEINKCTGQKVVICLLQYTCVCVYTCLQIHWSRLQSNDDHVDQPEWSVTCLECMCTVAASALAIANYWYTLRQINRKQFAEGTWERKMTQSDQQSRVTRMRKSGKEECVYVARRRGKEKSVGL